MPLEMIAIISLTLTSFLTWVCLLKSSRKMIRHDARKEASSNFLMQVDGMNIMEIIFSNNGSDKASLKRVIKTNTSQTQLKTVIYIVNMKGTINNFSTPKKLSYLGHFNIQSKVSMSNFSPIDKTKGTLVTERGPAGR